MKHGTSPLMWLLALAVAAGTTACSGAGPSPAVETHTSLAEEAPTEPEEAEARPDAGGLEAGIGILKDFPTKVEQDGTVFFMAEDGSMVGYSHPPSDPYTLKMLDDRDETLLVTFKTMFGPMMSAIDPELADEVIDPDADYITLEDRNVLSFNASQSGLDTVLYFCAGVDNDLVIIIGVSQGTDVADPMAGLVKAL